MILDSFINSRLKQNKETSEPKEKVKRSLVKTVSWRVIGTLDTVFISWLITGTLTLAISIGTLEFFSKMVLYFFHERAWNNIKWGK
ncbi:DUF2061 domain-containing protein [Aureibaculum marinum]|uniref:DUF2061 domain-containing protein n=1 Tax=Aureibaculum marinum TaxID=2487930 RepID=A0A3N4P1N6_9FLAO|nr:DUF2061 domain-containing protein [Aureibaculum marinum]RPD97739.1 DUF2061 domain-containing protein [Aureibaculum marinum]